MASLRSCLKVKSLASHIFFTINDLLAFDHCSFQRFAPADVVACSRIALTLLSITASIVLVAMPCTWCHYDECMYYSYVILQILEWCATFGTPCMYSTKCNTVLKRFRPSRLHGKVNAQNFFNCIICTKSKIKKSRNEII